MYNHKTAQKGPKQQHYKPLFRDSFEPNSYLVGTTIAGHAFFTSMLTNVVNDKAAATVKAAAASTEESGIGHSSWSQSDSSWCQCE